MRRKLAALLTSAVLALSLLGTTAGTVAANTGSCQSPSTTRYHVGNRIDPLTRNTITDLEAGMDIPDTSTDFGPCNPTLFDRVDNGASAWLSLQPYGSSNTSQIVQIGIISCSTSSLNPVCGGSGSDHFFYAYAGCNNTVPNAIDLGVADHWSHNYTMQSGWQNGLRWFGGSIDGVWKFTVWSNDSRISCWATGPTNGNWMGEQWDWGDSLGTYGTGNQNWWSAYYQNNDSSTWVSPGWTAGSCGFYASGSAGCNITGANAFYTFTSN